MDSIRCEGAPRALGLDQGRRCAEQVRAWFAARGQRHRAGWVRPRLTGGAALGAGVGREVVRHFPHLVERMTGIARGAGVSIDALMEDLVASSYGDETHPMATCTPAVAAIVAGGDPILGRSVDPEAGWIVRQSCPEVGFTSVEVVAPWVVGAVGGVNESGVSALAAAGPARAGAPRPIAAPAWLLVQECLQRFDSLQASVDWCLTRPSSGAFCLLLGDATGEVAVVEAREGSREVTYRGHGGVVAGGEAGAAASLRQRVDSVAPADVRSLFEGAAQLWLHPGERRLQWQPGEGVEASEWRVAPVRG